MENSKLKPSYDLEKLIPEQKAGYAGVDVSKLSENDKNILLSGGKTETVFFLKEAQLENGNLYSGPARLFLLRDKAGNSMLKPLKKEERPNFNQTPDGAVWLADGKKLEGKEAEKLLAGLPVSYYNKPFEYENGKVKLDAEGKKVRKEETVVSIALFDKELNRVISKDLKSSILMKENLATKSGKSFTQPQIDALKNAAVFSNEKDGNYFKLNYNPITNQIENKKIDKAEFDKIQKYFPVKGNDQKETQAQKVDNKEIKQATKTIKPPKAASQIKP